MSTREAFLYWIWAETRTGASPWWRRLGRMFTHNWVGRYHTGERLRHCFEQLGPTYIKFGQILSTRWDILPKEVTDALETLQVHVRPFPYTAARDIIEGCFKRPLHKVFLEFEPMPIASASLGQVYRARLPGGEKVAVKVQRPGTHRILEVDIAALTLAVRAAIRLLPSLKPFHLEEVVKEFRRWTMQELDYTREAANADIFAQHFAHDPHISSPRVYWDYTTKEVLTLEFIEAESLETILKRPGQDSFKQSVVRNGMRSFMRQYFEYGFFHADPHPNNIFVGKKGMLYFLDFGMVGKLDQRLTELAAGVFLGLLQRDTERIAQIMSLIHDEYADERHTERSSEEHHRLRKAIGEVVDQWMGVRDRHHNFTRIFYELVQATVHNGFFVPVDVVMMAKSIVTLDAVVRALDPDFNFADYETELLQRILAKKLQPKEITGQARDVALALERMIRSFPAYSQGVVRRLSEGQIGMELSRAQLEEHEDRLERSSERRNLITLSAALMVCAALFAQLEQTPRLFGFSFSNIAFAIAILLLLKVVFSNVNPREKR